MTLTTRYSTDLWLPVTAQRCLIYYESNKFKALKIRHRNKFWIYNLFVTFRVFVLCSLFKKTIPPPSDSRNRACYRIYLSIYYLILHWLYSAINFQSEEVATKFLGRIKKRSISIFVVQFEQLTKTYAQNKILKNMIIWISSILRWLIFWDNLF